MGRFMLSLLNMGWVKSELDKILCNMLMWVMVSNMNTLGDSGKWLG
jgi:hypothetical protein